MLSHVLNSLPADGVWRMPLALLRQCGGYCFAPSTWQIMLTLSSRPPASCPTFRLTSVRQRMLMQRTSSRMLLHDTFVFFKGNAWFCTEVFSLTLHVPKSQQHVVQMFLRDRGEHLQNLLPDMKKLTRITLAIPVSQSMSERSFVWLIMYGSS